MTKNIYYELHLSHDDESLKADILKHEDDCIECVKIITTFKELYDFIDKGHEIKVIKKS